MATRIHTLQIIHLRMYCTRMFDLCKTEPNRMFKLNHSTAQLFLNIGSNVNIVQDLFHLRLYILIGLDYTRLDFERHVVPTRVYIGCGIIINTVRIPLILLALSRFSELDLL